MVRALPSLPGVEFVVAAGAPGYEIKEDPVAQSLSDLASRLGVADRVRLLGSVPSQEMPGWYRSADVVACTPTYEPFGITPLEAMACGTPVVAYRVGGLQDTVVDGKTGLLVPPGDLRALSAALGGLLADEKRRDAFGQAARKRVVQHYPWPRLAERVEKVYTQAITALPVAAFV